MCGSRAGRPTVTGTTRASPILSVMQSATLARPILAATGLAHEVAGAFGDIGVFLPLALGLIAVNGMDPTLVFGLAGAYYLLTGRFYRLPLPVQPFKAVSAIAIAGGLSGGAVRGGALGAGGGGRRSRHPRGRRGGRHLGGSDAARGPATGLIGAGAGPAGSAHRRRAGHCPRRPRPAAAAADAGQLGRLHRGRRAGA